MVSPPEWDVVRREVQAALVAHTSVPMQLARCARIDVYTDGSAPEQNPDGPIGFAAIVLGFAPCQATGPAVRLDVGGYLPGRTADPGLGPPWPGSELPRRSRCPRCTLFPP